MVIVFYDQRIETCWDWEWKIRCDPLLARATAECFVCGGLHKEALRYIKCTIKINAFNYVSQLQLQAYTADIKRKAIIGIYMLYSSKFALTGKLTTTNITGNLRTLVLTN